MQTARKNVSFAMKILYGFLAILLVPIVIFILPNQVGLFFLAIFIKFHEEILYAITGMVFVGLLYWLFKSKDKEILRKKLYKILAVPVVLYALLCIFVYAFPTKYDDCKEYTDKLKGGAHEFQGKKYTIKLCGVNTFNNSEEIRMQVLDEEGKILALRYFTIRSNFAGPRELEYGSDAIFYNDYSKDEALSTLDMPPTKIDWIRSKFPLFN